MSFAALLTDRAHLLAREPGRERWARLTAEPLPCRVVFLSPREVEMALAQAHAEVTHRGRCLPNPHVKPGRKLALLGGPVYLILAVVHVPNPRPHGHLVLDLQALPPETEA